MRYTIYTNHCPAAPQRMPRFQDRRRLTQFLILPFQRKRIVCTLLSGFFCRKQIMRKLLQPILAAACLLSHSVIYATTHTVNAGGSSNTFSPSNFTMVVGDTVKWVIASGTHNTISTAVPSSALQWSSGSMSGSQTFIYVPTITGTYFYECSFHSGMMGQFMVTNCSAPGTPMITSSGGSTACQGATGMTLSTAAQSGATFQWYNGAALISGATSSSFVVPTTTTGTASYSVKATGCNSIAPSSAFPVTVNAAPAPAFTVSGSGLTRTFTNTTSGAGITYSWDFGDGTPLSTQINPTHAYTTSGAKTVTLTATITATGCNKTAQQTVQVLTTGVAIVDSEKRITVIPNPASTSITVGMEDGTRPVLSLTDFTGRVVDVPAAVNGNDQHLDVQHVPAGIYLLRIATEKSTSIRKILVQH